MGFSGLLWSKFFIHSKEGPDNLFLEKMNLNLKSFTNSLLEFAKFIFPTSVPYLVGHQDFLLNSKAIEDGKLEINYR